MNSPLIMYQDMTGIAQPRSMTIALIAAFEQCRGFTDHPGHTNSSITTSVMKPAVSPSSSLSSFIFPTILYRPKHAQCNCTDVQLIICTPSLQPLTFRRPSKLDVRRSPVRALLFDTFLRKEVALDEYVAGFNGTGTEVGDAGGMDIGRDEKARGMMRAREYRQSMDIVFSARLSSASFDGVGIFDYSRPCHSYLCPRSSMCAPLRR